mmetsp:Transcript_7330/g.7224  ORF Transcript_7330/g.7224 Transcript_7330/m.7224 type:complete len:121 (-) Transcript_7330:48-410(-)
MCLDIGLTIPGATTLSFAGGLFFDQPYAAIFSYMGYVIGACVSYLLVRTVLADFAKWLLNTESRTYKKLERNLKNNAFDGTLSIFLLIIVRASSSIMGFGDLLPMTPNFHHHWDYSTGGQ